MYQSTFPNVPKRMRNEKPSKLSNLGQDVAGAVRHAFDTYDNPEKAKERERAKKEKDHKKDLKEKTIELLSNAESLENALEIIYLYEIQKAFTLGKFPGYSFPGGEHSESVLKKIRAYVVSQRGVKTYEEYNLMARAYNALSNLKRRVRWNIRTLESAQNYLAPKTKSSFKEFNGVQRPWALNLGPFEVFPTFEVNAFLEENTRAVQFGNSLTLSEREYCLINLKESIELLNTKYDFDFKSLAFSFGARGKPGSIAHYEDHRKVLAFNRGWSGAFIHELGHAVDYALGLPSNEFPWELKTKYRQKISKLGLGPYAAYYLKNVEIFARLFEVYMREQFPEMSEFMQVTYNDEVMPDLCEESKAWIKSALTGLTKS